MVGLLSIAILACPLSADPALSVDAGAPEREVSAPTWWTTPDTTTAAATPDAPRFAVAPLWDLERLAADRGASPWLRWSASAALGRPATAQAHLVEALADESLRANDLAWWRVAVPTAVDAHDAHDALFAAFELASSAETRRLLASALALTHYELSCAPGTAPDGTCRAGEPAGGVLRRDPISVERARHWRQVGEDLRLETSFGRDPAATALFAELTLAESILDHEAMLVVKMPMDLALKVDWWRSGHGVPEVDSIYARQLRRRSESIARNVAFFESWDGCRARVDAPQRELARAVDPIPAGVAIGVMLREANYKLALGRAFGDASPEVREAERVRAESGATPGPSPRAIASGLQREAQSIARQCFTTGRRLGGSARTIEACQSLHDALAGRPPLTELVPEPRAHSSFQRHAVQGLERSPSSNEAAPGERSTLPPGPR